MLRRVRALWRKSRDSSALGPLLHAIDQRWWARTILRADIVDVEFIAAQGSGKTARAAVRTYVRGGFRKGMSLNPLFMEDLVSTQLADADRVPALYAYVLGEVEQVRTSVAWDSVAYARAYPDSLESPGGPLGHAWRAARSGRGIDLGVDDQQDVRQWADVHRTAIEAAARSRRAGPTELRPLSAQVVLVSRIAADEDPARPLDAALEVARMADAEVVVAVADRATDAWVAAALLTLRYPRLQVVADARDVVDQVAEEAPQSGVVVVRGGSADVDAQTLMDLAAAGADGPVAPLWVSLDGTIASAGIIAHDFRATHLLAGHPTEDAGRLGASVGVVAIAGSTFARPVQATSTPPITRLDLIARAPANALPVLEQTDAADTDLASMLSPLGLEVLGWDASGPRLRRRPTQVRLPDGSAVPSLRWALKIVAPPGRLGEAWGDTHFARGLADALRQLGQEVVIDAYDARARPTAYLDDVVVALRGPEQFSPQPGALSILWIISHPDQITAEEITGFDIVYAGSHEWARSASARLGRPIEFLPQCTDARRFRPYTGSRTQDVVFVGTARGIPRPSVLEPIAAGVPVRVYGPDWRGWIPAGLIVATGIANSELPALYGSAAVVLNDHWPAMREAGFISNRLYDVVAAGGRAVSDHVDGISETFGGAVRTYRTVDELVTLLTGDLDDLFPSDRELLSISDRIRAEHSFDARARTLLSAALTWRGGSHGAG